MGDLLFLKHHIHSFKEMSLLLRLEHHFYMHAFLGTESALVLAQVKTFSLIDLLWLDEPIYVEFVGVSDLEGTHEAGFALAEDAGVEGNVVRLKVHDWLNAAAD